MLKKEPKLEKFEKPAHLFMSVKVTEMCEENEKFAQFVDRCILNYEKRAREFGHMSPDYRASYVHPRGKLPPWKIVITTSKPKNKRLSTLEVSLKDE